MRYSKEVLDKALQQLFRPEAKINLLEKTGIKFSEVSDYGWIIPFAGKKAWLFVSEESLELDIPAFYLGKGSHGLVLSDVLFYIKEDGIDEEFLKCFREGSRPLGDTAEEILKKLKNKQAYIYRDKAEEGYFFVYTLVRFDFAEILREKIGEDVKLYYPDHLKAKPEPKLGLRYAIVSLSFSPSF